MSSKSILKRINNAETIELLKEMVAIQSVNRELVTGDEKDEGNVVQFLAKKLKDYGFNVETQEVEEKRYNVIGRLSGKGSAILSLNGHIDTVTGANMPDAFSPQIKGGKLYGRGACDMKGGIVSMIMGAKAIHDTGVKLGGDLVLTLVVDEEQYGKGTQKYLETEHPDYCVIAEPTENKICISQAGYIELDLECKGRIKHGSSLRLSEDDSAFVNATRILNKFMNLPSITKVETFEGVEIPNTINFCPKKYASYSSYAWMTNNYVKINILVGVGPSPTLKESENKMDSIIREMNEVVEDSTRATHQNELEVLCRNTGFIETAMSDEFLKNIVDSVRDAQGSHELSHILSFCDGTFAKKLNIPTVLYGPGSVQQAHGTNEFVELEQVLQGAHAYALLSERILGVA